MLELQAAAHRAQVEQRADHAGDSGPGREAHRRRRRRRWWWWWWRRRRWWWWWWWWCGRFWLGRGEQPCRFRMFVRRHVFFARVVANVDLPAQALVLDGRKEIPDVLPASGSLPSPARSLVLRRHDSTPSVHGAFRRSVPQRRELPGRCPRHRARDHPRYDRRRNRDYRVHHRKPQPLITTLVPGELSELWNLAYHAPASREVQLRPAADVVRPQERGSSSMARRVVAVGADAGPTPL